VHSKPVARLLQAGFNSTFRGHFSPPVLLIHLGALGFLSGILKVTAAKAFLCNSRSKIAFGGRILVILCNFSWCRLTGVLIEPDRLFASDVVAGGVCSSFPL